MKILHSVSRPVTEKSSLQAGMSLIELMIAMIVMSVGLLGAVSMIMLGMQNNSLNRSDTTTTVLDQEILEKFATLKTYPKPAGSIIISDCALNGGNQHLASIAAAVGPAGAGATLYTASPPAPTASQIGDIDWTQPAPTLATAGVAGYDMLYQSCSGEIYEVRWNEMAIDPDPVTNISRLTLLTISSRPRSAVFAAASGSANQAVLYAQPTTIKSLIEN